MPNAPDPWLETRTTLVHRLRDWEDAQSWQDFLDTYGRLIHRAALKAGLPPAEAEDAVQDTLLTVAQRVKTLDYDRERGSFKSWLLTLARSRIVDRWRRSARQRTAPVSEPDSPEETSFVNRIPDPATLVSDAAWEQEWRQTLYEIARTRVQRTADPRHFQVFDCFVRREWSAAEIAQRLQVKEEQVYVIKHRLAAQIEAEVRRLERAPL